MSNAKRRRRRRREKRGGERVAVGEWMSPEHARSAQICIEKGRKKRGEERSASNQTAR